MQQRQLGPFSVGAIGLGCMNICYAYGTPVSEADAERLLLAALDAGVTHIDTAALYGFGASETLVGKFLSKHRARFTLASKCGMAGVPNAEGVKVRVIDGRPATLKADCEKALQRLQTDVIDLYYLHRWDKQVPVEDSQRCRPARCAARMRCTPSPRCRPSIRSGRATPRSLCSKPAASWA